MDDQQPTIKRVDIFFNFSIYKHIYMYVAIYLYKVLFSIFCLQYTGLPIHLLENGPSAFEKITCFSR